MAPPRTSHLIAIPLLLLLLLLPSLAATSGVSIPIPANATSAQRTWQGIRQPDYDLLYTQYELPLACGHNMLPVGVLGYYGWLADLVVSGSNLAAAAGRLRSSRNKGKIALSCASNGAVALVHYVLRLYILVTTSAMCSSVVRVDFDTVVDTSLAVNAIGYCYSMIAAIGVIVGLKAFDDAVGIVVALSLLYHFLGTAIYYRSYASFLYIDVSMLRSILAVFVVPIFLTVAVILAYLVFGCARNRVFALGWALAAASTIFHFWGTGMADVVLGRIVDDPYGTQGLQEGLGKLDLILASVFPVLGIFTAVLQFM